jgi:chromosome segregation protein
VPALVYIKRVELSHFKSFGGTTEVPLLPEFTVITGPNGSGKSNILDALLFALGLSNSKGMRADRLPDLVNSAYASRSRSTVEANISVTFDLNDWRFNGTDGVEAPPTLQPESHQHPQSHPDPSNPDLVTAAPLPQSEDSLTPDSPEWTVARKLRVTPSGTYTSTYYMNGEPCTLNQLHEQLNRLRIYPEGYNVVLQGDVTSIISMSPRDRRQIIDELAGVAQFDRKIEQAKAKLDDVKEREDRCRIVETELVEQRERLAKDRIKAQKYQELRRTLEEKTVWEAVLQWQQGTAERRTLEQQIQADAVALEQLHQQESELAAQIAAQEIQLADLNRRVKALGEEELLRQQSLLATQEAELRACQRQQQDLTTLQRQRQGQIAQLQQEAAQRQQQLAAHTQQRQQLQTVTLTELQRTTQQARQQLDHARQDAGAIASQSQEWVTQQTQLRQQADALREQLEPGRAEQAQLQERLELAVQQQQQVKAVVATILAEQEDYQLQLQTAETALLASEEQVAEVAQLVADLESELQIHEHTRQRLQQEHRDKQRQLDKQESLRQALQETQGTAAARLILETGLPGVHGLVAQLGRVEPRFQLALEIAAGGRLGYVVVEDDGVAAAGIELLKQKKAGRITFLPLNRIKGSSPATIPRWQSPEGLLDHAVNLIDFDPIYRDIFSYVFGSTVVFQSLPQARRHLGQYRMVTLEGELLETSGAMTGGSVSRRPGGLGFGQTSTQESAEVAALRDRLSEIEAMLERSELAVLHLQADLKQQTRHLVELRQQHRDLQMSRDQARQAYQRLAQQGVQLSAQLEALEATAQTTQARLATLTTQLPALASQLEQVRVELGQLEDSPIHDEWEQRQAVVTAAEAQLQLHQDALQEAERQLQELILQQQQEQERLTQIGQVVEDLRLQQTETLSQQNQLAEQEAGLGAAMSAARQHLVALEKTLGTEKTDRDRAEQVLRGQQEQRQQLQWQQQQLAERRLQRQQQLLEIEQQLTSQRQELPEVLPALPEEVMAQGIAALQQDLRSLAKRIQAMEPVNMLALEEYERTEARLQELTQKLDTLNSERTELLLRIENFTTLRQRAFMDAFDAVNSNFQEIFAQLSDGDGYLQLDDSNDPFSSGLNLVAHPKGKPVRRLASMSGGEKSLTALSFIFALQRYRPSPFYALDEVDSFLDGVNVERLAQVIRRQAQQAQFLVVSHRRPMIEAAERVIGVTQARGAHTQVLGLPQSAQKVSN